MILTIAKDGKPIEASIRFVDDAAVDVYMRQRFGTPEMMFVKMPCQTWFNGTGCPRFVFDGDNPAVARVLPKAAGLVLFIVTERMFESMRGVPPQPVIDYVATEQPG